MLRRAVAACFNVHVTSIRRASIPSLSLLHRFVPGYSTPGFVTPFLYLSVSRMVWYSDSAVHLTADTIHHERRGGRGTRASAVVARAVDECGWSTAGRFVDDQHSFRGKRSVCGTYVEFDNQCRSRLGCAEGPGRWRGVAWCTDHSAAILLHRRSSVSDDDKRSYVPLIPSLFCSHHREDARCVFVRARRSRPFRALPA